MARTTLNRSGRVTAVSTARREAEAEDHVAASSRSGRLEWAWTAGVGAVALGLFLTTFSPNLALADTPESVTGVKSLGVLHAPGYPTYVLVGHLWCVLVPFGSWSARLNLFSVVCSVVAIMAVFVLGRAFACRARRLRLVLSPSRPVSRSGSMRDSRNTTRSRRCWWRWPRCLWSCGSGVADERGSLVRALR